MATELRKTGISAVGDVPWGTHFCHFYETKQDLLDILIPYFKAGLENNEFCIWVAFTPLTVEEATNALRGAVPQFEHYLSKGDILILPHSEWYLKDGTFDLNRVIANWSEKLSRALDKGYDGLRVNGNEAWLTEKEWKDYSAYEERLNKMILRQRMLVLCTFPLAVTRANQLFDVARTHQFAIAKRQGQWEVLETPELLQAKASLKKLNDELEQRVLDRSSELAATNKSLRKQMLENELAKLKLSESEESYRSLFENSLVGIAQVLPDGFLYRVNRAYALMYGYESPEQLIAEVTDVGQQLYEVPAERQEVAQILATKGEMGPREFRVRRRDGTRFTVLVAARQVVSADGKLLYAQHAHIDITNLKQAEEQLRYQANLLDNVSDAIISSDLNLIIRSWNKAAEVAYGWKAEEIIGKSLFDVIPLEVPGQDTNQVLQKLFAEGGWNGDVVQKRKDGTVMHIHSATSLIRDQNGNPTGVVAVNRDVTERVQAEQRINLQLQRLHALHTIDQVIASNLDLAFTLNILAGQVTAQLGADAAAILVLHQEGRNLEYAAGQGFHAFDFQQARLRMGEGHAWQAVLEQKMIHVSNVAQSGDFSHAFHNEAFVTYYGVPLIAKGKVKGVLEVFHRAPLAPDAEWLTFLESLAGQAAISIDNLEMFEGLQRSNFELEMSYDVTLEGWSKALDLRDKETEGHTQRVTEMTLKLAREMGQSGAELVNIRRGSLLHDVGKLGIPDKILLKPGPLTEAEWVVMRKHPTYAYEWLSPIVRLRPALDIPYYHHEKWDGSGYPRGLRGNSIPLAARIFAIVDVYDALLSDRPYRKGWTKKKALEAIREQREKHFDPQVVAAFLRMLREE